MKQRRATLLIPDDLLERALAATGEGITPAVKKGLEMVEASDVYGRLRAYRGKLKFSIHLEELREE